MTPQETAVEAMSLIFKTDSGKFIRYVKRSVELLEASGWDIYPVVSAMLADLIKSGKEADIEAMRLMSPMVSLIYHASRYASALDNPEEFTWEGFLSSGYLNE